MDNRPDTSEDYQATPENAAGRARHGGYTVEQPDRSGTEVPLDARSLAEGQHTESVRPAAESAPMPRAEHRAPGRVCAALCESLRQHPVQTVVNVVGLALIVVALRRTRPY